MSAPDRTFNVLFLCTGNSARSIMAEAYLNEIGRRRFRAYSAGSHPSGRVNPFALEMLRNNRINVTGARSKGWEEFAKPGAPHMDIIITVCDQAAGETCPVWPGRPLTAHWGVEDPAAVEGSDEQKHAAFMKAFAILQKRIALLASLRLESLDRLATEQHLKLIGKEQ
ncbi:MAG: arsenate reductase ArsC [Betaproteobacteria bacterium]|nr:arsenate reductase ArsC [Betaproteobacteria bacterium]